MPEDTYRYDVAFSFLKQDEALATSLDELLRDRLSTFLYSKRQEAVAATDGEVTFGRVFRSEARIVVVLYRAGWGTSPWTRIEETAIRNRAYDDGYDFTVFIPLDDPPAVPQWLPRTRIWVGLDRWGVAGAASVIEARVQEAGGAPRQETVRDRAARLQRELLARDQRQQFRRSQAGVDACNAECERLFAELKSLGDALANPDARLHFRVEHDARSAVVYTDGYSLSVHLSLQWANSLDHSSLYVRLWDGAVRIFGRIPINEPAEILEEDWDFDVDGSNEMGWRLGLPDGRFATTTALAEHCYDLLLERLGESRMDRGTK